MGKLRVDDRKSWLTSLRFCTSELSSSSSLDSYSYGRNQSTQSPTFMPITQCRSMRVTHALCMSWHKCLHASVHRHDYKTQGSSRVSSTRRAPPGRSCEAMKEEPECRLTILCCSSLSSASALSLLSFSSSSEILQERRVSSRESINVEL